MTVPTPEEFLAQRTDPDEDDCPDDLAGDPLVSIARSLEAIALAVASRQEGSSELASLRSEYDEVERLHDAKQALIEQVLAICKPSTSKLANNIRAAIEPPVAVPPSGAESPPGPPVRDADVEEWRGYARSLGYNGPDIDTANRSQIRTMLGIDQTAGADS